MGLGSYFKRITKKPNKLFQRAAKNAGRAATGLSKFATSRSIMIAGTPISVAASVAANAIGDAGRVVGAGTTVLRNNPELAGIAGSMLGLPQVDGGRVASAAPMTTAAESPGSGVPAWAVPVGIAVGAVALLFALRRA